MCADYNIRDYGAVGDGNTIDSDAIQLAIDTCTNSGGGRVIVPAGYTFLCGTFSLKSNVELHIERGASIEASGNEADYKPAQVEVMQRTAGYPSVSDSITLIAAYHAHNIAITGGGTINGGGQKYIVEELPHIYRMKQIRPFTLFFVGCMNVTLEQFTIRDGAIWTIRLSGCEDIVIHGIRILNDLKLPNSDGIDLDQCRNARISDCHLVCGDDCICLKTCADAGDFGACENITVTGCTLMSTSCALMVGCEAHTPMRNIVFDSCVIQSSNRGLGIHMSHEGDIENVIFSNMIIETRLFNTDWWGRAEPIYICAVPWTHQDRVGYIRNIRFTNILCRSENGVFIYGTKPDGIQNILLENVRVEIAKWSRCAGGTFDIRPTDDEGLPEHRYAGLFMRNADSVTVRNCEVIWDTTQGRLPDYYGPAIQTENVTNLMLENFKGTAAHPELDQAVQHG